MGLQRVFGVYRGHVCSDRSVGRAVADLLVVLGHILHDVDIFA